MGPAGALPSGHSGPASGRPGVGGRGARPAVLWGPATTDVFGQSLADPGQGLCAVYRGPVGVNIVLNVHRNHEAY